jgi:hypothetical protein
MQHAETPAAKMARPSPISSQGNHPGAKAAAYASAQTNRLHATMLTRKTPSAVRRRCRALARMRREA